MILKISREHWMAEMKVGVTRYRKPDGFLTRHWAVFVNGDLLAVTLYLKGALAVAVALTGSNGARPVPTRDGQAEPSPFRSPPPQEEREPPAPFHSPGGTWRNWQSIATCRPTPASPFVSGSSGRLG